MDNARRKINITNLEPNKNLYVYHHEYCYGPFTSDEAAEFMGSVYEEPRLFEVIERPINRTLVYKCVIKDDTPPPPPPPPPATPFNPQHEYDHIVEYAPLPKVSKPGRGQFG